MDFSTITELFGKLGEEQDIVTIINTFAQIIAELFKVITNFFGSFGKAPEEDTTAAE